MATGIPVIDALIAARLALSLSLRAVGRELGVSAAAIHHLESGNLAAISWDKVQAYGALVGVAIPEERPETPRAARARHVALRLFYCPKPLCVRNHSYWDERGELRVLAMMVRTQRAELKCSGCGEVMESHCPHCDGQVVTSGTFCSSCGKELIPLPPPDSDPLGIRAALAAGCEERSVIQQLLSRETREIPPPME